MEGCERGDLLYPKAKCQGPKELSGNLRVPRCHTLNPAHCGLVIAKERGVSVLERTPLTFLKGGHNLIRPVCLVTALVLELLLEPSHLAGHRGILPLPEPGHVSATDLLHNQPQQDQAAALEVRVRDSAVRVLKSSGTPISEGLLSRAFPGTKH